MKKTRLFTAVCLVVVMLVASFPAALASEAISYGISWLFNPVEGVRGYVYASSPHGFIIKDYENDTTALVSDKGAAIPNTPKNFTYVGEDGIISFYNYSDGSSGIMDANGNDIISVGEDEGVYELCENRFAYVKENEEGYYTYGVIDKDLNEIIPMIYDYIYANGLICCSNDEGYYIYDNDGALIAQHPYDENSYISLVGANDRYMICEYNPSADTSVTKIMHINGSVIATIDGWAYSFTDSVLYRTGYSGDNYYYYYYDMDGNLLGKEAGEDAWNDGSLYQKFATDGNLSNYRVDYINYREVVVDQAGNIVFDNPDNMSIWSIIDDRFITVYDDGYTGLYQIDGTPIILPDYYDEISYCKELDIFAFGKDLQVSIAKLTPATPATPTISVDVYGKPVEFDQPPVLKDGRTLVPVRAISEALGASVDWDEATQTVTATLGDTVVKLVINSNRMLVNDKVIEIDVPAEIINSRTLIPVRAISEAFGCQVDWDDDNYRVIIS